MKLQIKKTEFLKSWALAEKNVSKGGGMDCLTAVLVTATENGVTLQATDVATAITCAVDGVTVIEEGQALLPVKRVGELFRKAAKEDFNLDVADDKATLICGKSRSKFATLSPSMYPAFDKSGDVVVSGKIKVKDFLSALSCGTMAGELIAHPMYLCSAWMDFAGDKLKIATTDNRRLAVSHTGISDSISDGACLIPIKSLRALSSVLSGVNGNESLSIQADKTQAYFMASGVVFAVRRVDSRFPPYEKIIPASYKTRIVFDRVDLFNALDRLDVIVRYYNRTVIIEHETGAECLMSAESPEFGQASESVTCAIIDGEPIKVGVNSRYLMEAIKAITDKDVAIEFNGKDGHLAIKRVDRDDYLCLLAPVEL